MHISFLKLFLSAKNLSVSLLANTQAQRYKLKVLPDLSWIGSLQSVERCEKSMIEDVKNHFLWVAVTVLSVLVLQTCTAIAPYTPLDVMLWTLWPVDLWFSWLIISWIVDSRVDSLNLFCEMCFKMLLYDLFCSRTNKSLSVG